MTNRQGPNNICPDCHGNGFIRLPEDEGNTRPCLTCEGSGVVAKSAGYPHSRWNDLLTETFEEIRFLAKAKGGEYSGDTDRLKNFRRNAEALGLNKETIWAVYAAKHWDAIMQYIKDLESDTKRERIEPIGGRIHDLIVYLLLLKAMIDEGQDTAA